MKTKSNTKRINSCRKVGGGKKKQGHLREDIFNKQFNPKAIGKIEYGSTSDCQISEEHKIIQVLKEKLNLSEKSNFYVSNKGGKSIQFTLGKIPELDCDNNLDYIKDKGNSNKLFLKYLKKNESAKPSDLLVYFNNETKEFDFFKMDDIVNYIVNNCTWRKLKSGRIKGDFINLSKKGFGQYITYEYRENKKSFFLGINGGKGFKFIDFLKCKNLGIPYHSETIEYYQ